MFDKPKRVLLVCIGAVSFALSPPVLAKTTGNFLPYGRAADAPAGFTEMCARQIDLCRKLHGSTPARLDESAETLAALERVNRHVNTHVIQRSDLQIYGSGDVWTQPGTGSRAVGDCEDLAIEKRIALLMAGFAADRLFFAVTYRPQIGLHTVLVARLADGDYVLDSRYVQVMPWYRTDYVWLRQQSVSDPAIWLTVEEKPGTFAARAEDDKDTRL